MNDDEVDMESYVLGGDDMCEVFLAVVDDAMRGNPSAVITLKGLRLLILSYKANNKFDESETVNEIVGLTDESVKH